MNNWVIISKAKGNIDINSEFPVVYECPQFKILSLCPAIKKVIGVREIIIIIEGFIVPRNSIFNDYFNLDKYLLVADLYRKYDINFVNYIKGNFNIIIIDGSKFFLFNDHLSLRKFFYYTERDFFIFSNNINNVIKYTNGDLNIDSLIIHTLYQHFLKGKTVYNNVFYSQPASSVHFVKEICFYKYWDSKSLITLERDDISSEEISYLITLIINNYIKYLKPQRIGLTLTGGRDTRIILSTLMKLGYHPYSYTFGDNKSADVVSSREMAQGLGIEFDNICFENINSKWYQTLTAEIIKIGNSMVHIHRAHRLDAVKNVKMYNSNIDMIFVGSMGGDYIKGAHLDDYIITKFARQWHFLKDQKNEVIIEILKENFLSEEFIDISKIRMIIDELNLDVNDIKHLEFKYVHNIVGCLHDTQDIAIFNEYVDYIIAPYMDIDFLYKLFSSKNNLFYNYQSVNKILKKYEEGKFQISLINNLFPALMNYSFAQKYKPKDLLGNKLIYFLKRAFYQVSYKYQYVPNFKYDDWFKNYVKDNINYIDQMKDIYNRDKVIYNIYHTKHKETEGYWHKYSNIIMFGMFREILQKN